METFAPITAGTDILSKKNWLNHGVTAGPDAPDVNYLQPSSNPSAEPLSSTFTPAASSSGSGVLSTIGKIAGVATPVIGALTSVGSLIMNWWAAKEQLKENKASRKAAQAAYNAEQTESRRRYDVETGLKEKEMKQQEQQFFTNANMANRQQTHTEELDKEKLAMEKDTKKWDRFLSLLQNTTNMMSTPDKRAGIANLYGVRR